MMNAYCSTNGRSKIEELCGGAFYFLCALSFMSSCFRCALFGRTTTYHTTPEYHSNQRIPLEEFEYRILSISITHIRETSFSPLDIFWSGRYTDAVSLMMA